MSQDVPYLFGSDSLLHQPHGEGMPQDVRSESRHCQSAALNPTRQYCAHRRRMQRVSRGDCAQKQLAMRGFGTPLAQIFDQHARCLVSQRKQERLLRLSLSYPQRASLPVNVVEP